MPVLASKSGRMASNKPLSYVLVVVASTNVLAGSTTVGDGAMVGVAHAESKSPIRRSGQAKAICFLDIAVRKKKREKFT